MASNKSTVTQEELDALESAIQTLADEPAEGGDTKQYLGEEGLKRLVELVADALKAKQDALEQGDNITIKDGVISATDTGATSVEASGEKPLTLGAEYDKDTRKMTVTGSVDLGGYATKEDLEGKEDAFEPGTGLTLEDGVLNCTVDPTLFLVYPEGLPERPGEGSENKIFLVPAETTGAGNIYKEYLWVDDTWEQFGELTATTELNGYLPLTGGSLSGDLTVNGEASAVKFSTRDGHVQITETLIEVEGKIYGETMEAGSLDVDTFASVDGTLTVQGRTNLRDTLNATNINAEGLYVDGKVNVEGTFYAEGTSTDRLSVDGDVLLTDIGETGDLNSAKGVLLLGADGRVSLVTLDALKAAMGYSTAVEPTEAKLPADEDYDDYRVDIDVTSDEEWELKWDTGSFYYVGVSEEDNPLEGGTYTHEGKKQMWVGAKGHNYGTDQTATFTFTGKKSGKVTTVTVTQEGEV